MCPCNLIILLFPISFSGMDLTACYYNSCALDGVFGMLSSLIDEFGCVFIGLVDR